MNKRTTTIDLKGKDYAQVKDRIIEFRTDNPNGLIETTPTIRPDGQVMFKARILKDKGEANSAESTGHSLGANKGDKEFEKLETIAVGRALALLGYSSSGEIASSEEMEEFEDYKQSKHVEMIAAMLEKLENCSSLGELKQVWADMPLEAKTALESTKDEIKAKLSEVKPVVTNKTLVKRAPKKVEETTQPSLA